MYCRKKIANIIKQNVYSFYDFRKLLSSAFRKGNKITPTRTPQTQSNLPPDCTSLSASNDIPSPVTSVHTVVNMADHVSTTEEHEEDETHFQEMTRNDLYNNSQVDLQKEMKINHQEHNNAVDLHEENTITKRKLKSTAKSKWLKPLQEVEKSFNESHPPSESPSSTPGHCKVAWPDIGNRKELKVPKLLVNDQPWVDFKKVSNPNFPDMKIDKLLISEFFDDEKYVEHKIEQMIQRLSESNFFENKEQKINIEHFIDPETVLLLLEYYGEDSRIITILRKYFNF